MLGRFEHRSLLGLARNAFMRSWLDEPDRVHYLEMVDEYESMSV